MNQETVNQINQHNPFQKKPNKVLIDIPGIPKHISLKIRIIYTHTQDIALKQQKYGRISSTSRIQINSIDGESLYLTSSPLIDFPLNMKNVEGYFDPRTTVYLSYMHIQVLKQALQHMFYKMSEQGLYYYINGMLNIDESKAHRLKELFPVRGMTVEVQHCVVKDISVANEYTLYEGVRIINRTNQSISELTIDELSGFINTLNSINIGDLSVLATQLGLSLLTMPTNTIESLFVGKN